MPNGAPLCRLWNLKPDRGGDASAVYLPAGQITMGIEKPVRNVLPMSGKTQFFN